MDNRFVLCDEWRDRLPDEMTFTAFDFETTGLSSRRDRICEIGAVRFTLKGGTEATFQSLVNPGVPIGAGASAVSGITDAMLVEAPALESQFPLFLQFIAGTVVVAHNLPFDAKFLWRQAARMDLPLPPLAGVDTLPLSRKAFPGMPDHKLQNLARRLGLEQEQGHRALEDAVICRDLFRKSLEHLRQKGPITMSGLCG